MQLFLAKTGFARKPICAELALLSKYEPSVTNAMITVLHPSYTQTSKSIHQVFSAFELNGYPRTVKTDQT